VPLVARIVLGLCGVALALYAAASLTGNWLATPPWWEVEHVEMAFVTRSSGRCTLETLRTHATPRERRELVSAGVGAVGLTLAGFAVLGRRRTEAR